MSCAIVAWRGVSLGFCPPVRPRARAEEATERLLGALGPLAAVAGDGLREEARAMVVELVDGACGPV